MLFQLLLNDMLIIAIGDVDVHLFPRGDLEKNSRQFYEKLLEKVTGISLAAQPSIFIQNGGVNATRQLTANNSQQVYLADEVLAEGNSSQADYSKINIEHSFNKKKEQIEKT